MKSLDIIFTARLWIVGNPDKVGRRTHQAMPETGSRPSFCLRLPAMRTSVGVKSIKGAFHE